MSFETLLVEAPASAPGVTLIRLNRPEALNALNTVLLTELGQALAAAQADDAIGCIVITGSAKAFAAGADIKEMSDKSYAQMFKENFFAPIGRAFETTRKPVVAAVSGYALGGGCELAMMCDFILAADTAKFGQPEINLGVAPGIGGTQRLTRLVGKSKAMDMILTGRMMGAEEAERAGLVSRIFPADMLVDEVLAIAAKIAAQSPLATAMNKELVNAAYETTLSTGIALERRLFHSLFAFDDQKEGMGAFVEKRKPAFQGT
jgi:enoyl-CoA hydratase